MCIYVYVFISVKLTRGTSDFHNQLVTWRPFLMLAERPQTDNRTAQDLSQDLMPIRHVHRGIYTYYSLGKKVILTPSSKRTYV